MYSNLRNKKCFLIITKKQQIIRYSTSTISIGLGRFRFSPFCNDLTKANGSFKMASRISCNSSNPFKKKFSLEDSKILFSI